MEQLQKRMNGAVQNLNARSIERMTTDVVGRINAGVQRLLANIEQVEERLGVREESSRRSLRMGLEAADGATGAVKGIAPFAALLASTPAGRLALLAGSALVGGLEGASRESRRRSAAAAAQADADLAYETRKRLRAIDEELERTKAARRAAKGLR